MDQKILRNLVYDAKKAYDDYPIMQRVVVTQGIWESHMNSPRGASQLSIRCNNLFGMKATQEQIDNGYYEEFPTWEHEDGEDKQIQAKFAKFKDHEECFEAHRSLMEHSRYKPVLDSDNIEEAFDQLQKCGYATDPNYPARLQTIYYAFVEDAFK